MSKIVLAGMHMMPDRSKTITEREVRFDVEGQSYYGRTDMVHDYIPGQSVVIGDHKFLADIDKYAMTPGQFANDPQRIVYSKWAADYYQVQEVTARWIYYQKTIRKPIQRLLSLTESRDAISTRIQALHNRVTLPLVASRGVLPEHMPYNLNRCTAFGGCDHIRECHDTMLPKNAYLNHRLRKLQP